MPAIRYVHEVGAGHDFEQLAGDMVGAANTGRAITNSTGIGLGTGDELRNRLGWNRRVHHHDVGIADDARDRRNVADEIEIQAIHIAT